MSQVRGVRRKLLLSLLLGALLLVALALYGDVSRIGASMAGFRWLLLPAAMGLALVNFGLRFLKWHAYLACLGLRVGRADSLLVFLSGLMLSVTPGKVGELLKSALLKESHDIPVTTSAPVVFAERFTDLLAIIALALFGVASSGYGVGVLVTASAVTGAMVVYLASRRLSLATIRLVGRAPVIGRFAPKLEELYESVARLVRPGPLLGTTLLSVVAWFSECLAFWVVLSGFGGVSCSLGQATFIYAFATLFGALTMLPGGLFATEGSMVGLLLHFAVISDKSVASAATLMIRFCTLWFAVLVGSLAFAAYRWRRRATAASAASGSQQE